MSKKVLVIDDSSTIRSLITHSLEELNDYEMVEAKNGFEALKALPRMHFDLIITDINMPEINGLEIVKFVRNHPEYQTIPLIIVSTENGEEDVRKALSLGANEYITKPFNPEQIKDVVSRLMSA